METPQRVTEVISKYPFREQQIIASFLRSLARDENIPEGVVETKEERSKRLRKESMKRCRERVKDRQKEYAKEYYIQNKDKIVQQRKAKAQESKTH